MITTAIRLRPRISREEGEATRRRFVRVTAAALSVAAAGGAMYAASAGGAGTLVAAGLAGMGAGGGALWSLRRRPGALPADAAAESEAWTRFLVGVAGGMAGAALAAPRGVAAVGTAALLGGFAAPWLHAALVRVRSVLGVLVRGLRASPEAAALLRRARAPAEEQSLMWAAQLLGLRAAFAGDAAGARTKAGAAGRDG